MASFFYTTYFPCDTTNSGPVLSADTELSIGSFVSGSDGSNPIRCYKIVAETTPTTGVASFIKTHTSCTQCEIDICRDYPLPTLTSTATATPTITASNTPTPTITPSNTGTSTTPTPTSTLTTPTPTSTPPATPSFTPSSTIAPTPTVTPSTTSLISCDYQDVMLLIDESGSVTDDEWQNMIDGCINIINTFKPAMDTGKFQVGIMRWSFCNDVDTLVSLTSGYTSVYNALTGATKLYSGGTQPSNAIAQAYTELESSVNSGLSEKNIIILTDGVFNDYFNDNCNIGYSTSEICNSIKAGLYSTGIPMKIIIAGIGQEYDPEQLLEISSGEEFFLESTGTTQLEAFENFADNLSKTFAGVVCSETPDNENIDVWRAVKCCGEDIIFVGVPSGTTISEGYDGFVYFDSCYYFHSPCLGHIDYLVELSEIRPNICNFSGCTDCPTPSPTPTNTVTPGLTPTATPTLTATPTITPSNTVTPGLTPTATPTTTTTPTPTQTPTQSYDICVEVTSIISVVDNLYSPTPTPTLTQTPTPSLQRDNQIQSATTFVIDYGYFECNEVAKLTDCNGGDIYFVNTPLIYQGNEIQTGKVIRCQIDGEDVCATYNEKTDGTSTNFIFNISAVENNCGDCVITTTNTPTPTTTPTITPTLSPTPSTYIGNFVYVYSACGLNRIVTQTYPVTEGVNPLTQGQVFNYKNDCWAYVGLFNNPYFAPSGFVVTSYDYNFFGTFDSSDIYVDCGSCESS